MRIGAFTAFAFIAVAVGGCAPKVWYKEGASQSELQRDREECGRLAQQQLGMEGLGGGSGNSGGRSTPAPFGGSTGSTLGGSSSDTTYSPERRGQQLLGDCLRARGYEEREEVAARQ